MGYDRIEALVRNAEKPYEYCLDFEYGNSAYEALNPIERYLAYKSTGVKVDKTKQNLSNAERFCLYSLNTYGDIPDCDGSDGRNLLTLDVYKKLWNLEKGYYSFGEISTTNFAGEFGGDTMNSMQTTFNAVMKYALSKSEDSNLRKCQKKNYSFLDCLQIYCAFPEKLMSELCKEPDFIRFADLYHTIGNMVLVPRRFNSGRYGKTFDFWDSSLVWLKNDGFAYGNQLMFDKRNFTKYINYFYLWDYVECVNGEYRVKPLFNSHSHIESGSICNTYPWTNIITEQDLKQFLRNSCENIRNRGIFMTMLMRLKSTDNPQMKEICKRYFDIIQGDEFLNSAHKNGINDALYILLSLLNYFDDKEDREYRQIHDGVMSLYKNNVDDDTSDYESIGKTKNTNLTPKTKVKKEESKENSCDNTNVQNQSKIKDIVDSVLYDFKDAPLESISLVIFWAVLVLSIGYGAFLYIRFLMSGGYDNNFSNENFSSGYYGNNTLMNILFFVDIFGFLLLCVSYIRRKKKVKKVLMIIALSCIAISCVLCSMIPIGINILENNKEFMDWFNKDAVNNSYMIRQFINNYAQLLVIIICVFSIFPLILLLIDEHYRYYLKTLGLSLLIFGIAVPIILGFLQIKIIAILLLVASIIAIVLFTIFGIIAAIEDKCPACKRFNALCKVDDKFVSEKDISILVQVENRNRNGEFIGTSEQYIPGVRKIYEVTYQCCHCGYIKTEMRHQDVKKL